MPDVVVVDAVRTPFGKRGGALSQLHSVELLASVMQQVFERTGVDPAEVGQVVGGCVGQVGMQSNNIARGAWLLAGLPVTTPGTTVDAQCGSSQQAANLAAALVQAGVVDVALACGVELMSGIPLGSTVPKDGAFGKPITRKYWAHHEFTTQFEAAERIADAWGLTRNDTDEFAKLSQDRAAVARDEGRFRSQLVPVEAADVDGAGRVVDADEGIRPTTLEALAGLKPTGRPDGVHTAGSSSQISDGASAVLLMGADKARSLGVQPLATVVDTCLVGTDPVMMLTGPIPATRRLLAANRLTMDDIDVVEINEAFASVVLAWERELKPDMATVNPNGGAIALGHPVGATGSALIAKAVHELVRADGEHALVTMCCGGGLGTGTLLRRS
ncbi:MAG: acetyl-CoA C-acyltransferase [Actinobacteria bacterium]|nr:acetyl-CoA C-acyltransferase [Actinomycetota bacterium]